MIKYLLLGMVMILMGGSLAETFILEFGTVGMVLCGLFFGGVLFLGGIAVVGLSIYEFMNKRDQEVIKALKRDEADQKQDGLRSVMVNFRKHYAQFFHGDKLKQNEDIQWEATQLYRNILEIRKKRLLKLGIVCDTVVKSMEYLRPDGIKTRCFSDGKYDITEVEEEIAAKTIYQKDGKKIYTQRDKELAHYTIVHGKQVGEDKLSCPNCGVETTREELLDGCDYCGTKFLIEDLDTRVAEFAFRPDYDVAYAKYKKRRDKVLVMMLLVVMGVVFVGAVIYAFTHLDQIGLEAGPIMTVTAILLASGIFAMALIPILLVIYSWLIALLPALLVSFNLISKGILKKLKEAPTREQSDVELIRRHDPYFSISNFYTGLQNKIFSIVYADQKSQMQAFADCDLSAWLGRYDHVIDIETEYMGITHYQVGDSLQEMEVEVNMNFLVYQGKKCTHQKEAWKLKLAKLAECKTQVVCGPAIMTCKGCGASLDILKGKTCLYCGKELDMKKHDWVIQDMQVALQHC